MTLGAVPGAYKKILQQILDCCKPFVIHAVLALYGCRCRLARHSSAERGAIALSFAPAVYRSRVCPSLSLFFPASYSALGGLPPLPRAAWRILGARNRGGPDPTRGHAPGGTQGPTARIKRTPQPLRSGYKSNAQNKTKRQPTELYKMSVLYPWPQEFAAICGPPLVGGTQPWAP